MIPYPRGATAESRSVSDVIRLSDRRFLIDDTTRAPTLSWDRPNDEEDHGVRQDQDD